MSLLERVSFRCGVSSVLNKDVKQNGKQFMFDAEEDTAWTSNEGSPQWVQLQFDEPQSISEFSFQFQGGFAGKNGKISVESPDGRQICDESFYPDDVNSMQTFKLKTPAQNAIKVKFIFGTSTDFFGRIIVYKLRIL